MHAWLFAAYQLAQSPWIFAAWSFSAALKAEDRSVGPFPVICNMYLYLQWRLCIYWETHMQYMHLTKGKTWAICNMQWIASVGVCKNWETCLHDSMILQVAVPELFYCKRQKELGIFFHLLKWILRALNIFNFISVSESQVLFAFLYHPRRYKL